MTGYIETAISSELADLSSAREGNRNAQLFKSAAALFGLVKGGGCERGTVTQQLESTARGIGLSNGEIQTTLQSAWKAAEARAVESAGAETPTSKRAYKDLADYAQEHGVDVSVYIQAGWEWTYYDQRPCLKYGMLDKNGTRWHRYRFMDGNDPRFKHDTGFPVQWYGLERALSTKPDVLVLCNGAPSVVAAQSWGVPAVAQEGHGEKAIDGELLKDFNAKWSGSVYICLEADDQGNKTAETWATQFPNAKRIDLQLTGGQDLADFCKLYQKDSLAELHRRAKAPETDSVSQSIQVLSDGYDPKRVTRLGLLSRIQSLDNAIGSFMPHREHIILGATGMGKTTLAISLGMALLWQKPGLFVSTETPPFFWVQKMLAYASNIPVHKLIEGTLTPTEQQTVAKRKAQLRKYQARVYNSMAPEVSAVCEWAKRWQEKLHAEWIVIDSISRLKAKGKHGIFDRTSEVADQLQDLVRETGLILIGTAQVGRKMDDRGTKIPRITDGKGSGAIEENADVVLPLYYHHYYVTKKMVSRDDPLNESMPEGKAMVYVGKHRYRYTDEKCIWLQFRGGIGFHPWPEHPPIPTQTTIPMTGTNGRDIQDIIF
jgi:hypothetical protein